MKRTTQTRILGVWIAVCLVCICAPAYAFSILTGFTTGCHEDITLMAYLASDISIEAKNIPVPPQKDALWRDVADILLGELGIDFAEDEERFFVYSLLMGVRNPDTDGGSALNLGSIRTVHLAEEGQYEHCLRSVMDDGEEGEQRAVQGCRQHIIDTMKETIRLRALEDPQQIIVVDFSTDFYGSIEVEVWAPAYFLGRATHALQDGFTHALRTPDLRKIIHVMNFTEALTGSLEEVRDGMAHSLSMDDCRNPATGPITTAAVEASTDLFQAASTGVEEPVQQVVEKWLGYQPGCDFANAYCDSPWVAVAREEVSQPVLGCASVHTSQKTPWPWGGVGLMGLLCLWGCRRRRTRTPPPNPARAERLCKHCGVALLVTLGVWGSFAPSRAWANTPLSLSLEAQKHDAAIDRGLLGSHAEVLGENRISLNVYELLFVGVSYGLTDDFQLTMTSVLNEEYGFIGHAKYVFHRSGPSVFSVSGRGAAFDPTPFGTAGSIEGFAGAGFLCDHILDSRGRFSVYLEAAADLFLGIDQTFEATLTLGASRNIEEHLKLLVEVRIPATINDGAFAAAEVINVTYGFRLHWDYFAFDLSFIRTTFNEDLSEDNRRLLGPALDVADSFPLGIPWLTFNARL